MGFNKEDLSWITSINFDERNEQQFIQNIIGSFKPVILSNADTFSLLKMGLLPTLTHCFSNSGRFVFYSQKGNLLYQKRLNKSTTLFFKKTNSKLELCMIQKKLKEQTIFWNGMEAFRINNKESNFVTYYSKVKNFSQNDNSIYSDTYRLNSFYDTPIFSKNKNDSITLFHISKKVVINKSANKNEILATEYNYFNKKTGVYILTTESVLSENNSFSKSFLEYENLIYVKVDENGNDDLVETFYNLENDYIESHDLILFNDIYGRRIPLLHLSDKELKSQYELLELNFNF